MEQRDQKLLSLRPTLDLDSTGSGEMEFFQNGTLRPVLKMQHEVLLSFFKAYVKMQYGSGFEEKLQLEQRAFITNTLRTDVVLRNQLIGMVLGQFTLPEVEFYSSNTKDLRKRIGDLLVQRLHSAY